MSNTVILSKFEEYLKDNKKQLKCGGCDSTLQFDHIGIQCIQGHDFCVECSKRIVDLFFSEPHHHSPLRCLQCRVELNPVVFERQLTSEQYAVYQSHLIRNDWANDILLEGERLDNCPFCTYIVIRGTNDSHILYCSHPECSRISCTICRKECPRILDDYATDEEIEEMDKHHRCATLAESKKIFDEYVELGSKVPCPSCNLAGMKDEACTHMTCRNCGESWCYFCGKKEEDCNKAYNGTNGILDHNHNWELNPNRCPMYMTQIQDIDSSWPENEQDCLAKFHRIRSLRLLRDAYETIGDERIRELDDHFSSLKSCGFTLDEILNDDLILIKRQLTQN